MSQHDHQPGVPRVLVEICVDDVEGALVADREGADRVELCADLAAGGTTPSTGTVVTVLRSVRHVGVQVIVRPRGGDFVHDAAELDVLCADLEAIARLAATEARTPVGVVLGVLTPDGEIDEPALRRLVAAAAPLPVTVHKAFDATVDLLAAYDVLHRAGVERVLTSGGPHPAAEGVDVLAELVRRSAAPGAPRVLVGGGVRPDGVRALLAATGAREVHLRAQSPSPRGDGTLRTDPEVVRAMVAAVAGPSAEVGAPGPVPATPPVVPDAPAVAAPPAARRPPVVVAVDLGGTSIKGSLVDERGRTTALRTVDGTGRGQDAVDRLVTLLHELCDRAGAEGREVAGVGVVVPGLVDAATGSVRYASSLDWRDLELGAVLSAELGVPVQVDHDVRSSGLAERLFGAAAGADDVVVVSIGTGVAAAVASGGRPVVGALAAAGELGHVTVHPDGEPCPCGRRGCLEAYCSGAALERRYALAGGAAGTDAAGVVARLGTDAVADRVWADAVRALALGLATVTLLVDPATIVLTGGVARADEALLAPLRVELDRQLAWRAAPALRTSPLGTAGGRIGAAVLAFEAAGRGDVPGRWSADDVTVAPTTG